MNLTLAQLAHRAGITVNAEIERFAELIVRECALLCVSRPGPGDDARSREHCSEQILQHFGVEE